MSAIIQEYPIMSNTTNTNVSIVHELIKPLNTILGFTQILSKDKTLQSDHKEMIALIHRSGETLLSQIHELFDLDDNETEISFTVKEIVPLEVNTSIQLLVVDDVATNLLFIEKMLSRYSNITTHGAIDAQSAIDQITKIRPQIVLLDIHLSDMNGFEVIQHIRKDAQYNNIIFIMMSSDPIFYHEDQLKSCDVKAYLKKPIHIKNLITLLERFLTIRSDESQEEETLPIVSQPDKLPDENYLKEIIRLARQGAYSEIKNVMEQLQTKQSEFIAFIHYLEQLLKKFQFNEIIDWINSYKTKGDHVE